MFNVSYKKYNNKCCACLSNLVLLSSLILLKNAVLYYCLRPQFVLFSHVSRLCNKVADLLAKKARIGSVSQVWFEDFPREITSLTFADSV